MRNTFLNSTVLLTLPGTIQVGAPCQSGSSIVVGATLGLTSLVRTLPPYSAP